MKNTHFIKKSTKYFVFAALTASNLVGCGDDSSSNNIPNSPSDGQNQVLPDTLSSLTELQMNYVCNESLKCKGVYLLDMGYSVCDGQKSWTFGSLIHEMGCGIDFVPGYDEEP